MVHKMQIKRGESLRYVHRLPLLLFANPLNDQRTSGAGATSSTSLTSPSPRRPSVAPPRGSKTWEHSAELRDIPDADRSLFKPRHEAKTVELFFDLFFVANLTVFSIDHEINDGGSLTSYIGFFSLLWFTWLQVTLFDVRFSVDSVFERCCKALHFGVMTGFGVVGPSYQRTDEYETMQVLSLVLMASRWILVGQYAVVLWFARKQKDAILPLVLQLSTLVLSAVVFLGLYFSFNEKYGFNGQIGWYIISVFEALSLLSISSYWHKLSFHHTCLSERVGLLTLIIIGEGIVGFLKTLSKISGTLATVSMVSGQATSAVLITYFLFHLYFDHVDTDRFGSIRQHVWAILHYPLHIVFLLTLEGVNQLALFTVAQQQVNSVDLLLMSALPAADPSDQFQIIEAINATINHLEASFASSPPIPSIIESSFDAVLAGNITADGAETLSSAVALFILQSYGFNITSYSDDGYEAYINVIVTAYLYFFISSGSALLILALFLWLGTKKTNNSVWGCIGVRVAIGTGLCLSTMMLIPSEDQPGGTDPWGTFAISGWLLPTVVLCYGFVLLIDKVMPKVFLAQE